MATEDRKPNGCTCITLDGPDEKWHYMFGGLIKYKYLGTVSTCQQCKSRSTRQRGIKAPSIERTRRKSQSVSEPTITNVEPLSNGHQQTPITSATTPAASDHTPQASTPTPTPARRTPQLATDTLRGTQWVIARYIEDQQQQAAQRHLAIDIHDYAAYKAFISKNLKDAGARPRLSRALKKSAAYERIRRYETEAGKAAEEALARAEKNALEVEAPIMGESELQWVFFEEERCKDGRGDGGKKKRVRFSDSGRSVKTLKLSGLFALL